MSHLKSEPTRAEGGPSSWRLALTGLVLVALLWMPLTSQTRDWSSSELLRESDTIFVGQVMHREHVPSADGRFILTRYHFRVESTLKGEDQPDLVVTEYGGIIGSNRLSVSHTARYSPGRRYLVLTRSDEFNRTRTVGGPAGQLSTIDDATAGSLARIYAGHPLAELFGGGSRLVPLDLLQSKLATEIRRVHELQ